MARYYRAKTHSSEENAAAAPHAGVSGGAAFRQLAGGGLDVVLQSHLVDESQLLLDEVDMFFLAFLDVHQQLPSDQISDRFAVCDGVVVERMRGHFALQIAQQDLFYILADEQLAEILQVRQ